MTALVVLLVLTGAAAALALLPGDLREAPDDRNTAAGPRVALRSLALEVPALPPPAVAPTVAVTRVNAKPTRAKVRRASADYYRRTAARRVPASTSSNFMGLYRESARTFGVSWRLIASIHRQETAFSTAPGTYRGLNDFGCCAGPMQFNVTNGPVSTWDSYKQSFKAGNRPRVYPNRATFHPSIYDDFDAIMAAGALLRDSGATPELGGGSWSAAYAYYGRDLFGIGYASQVLARARGWERDGFCPNCQPDAALVAAFDDAYGVNARQQLLSAEARSDEAKRKRRVAKRRRAAARRVRAAARRRAGDKTKRSTATRPSKPTRTPAPARSPKPAPRPSPPAGPTGPTGPTGGTAPATTAPPTAEAPKCSTLDGLAGCTN